MPMKHDAQGFLTGDPIVLDAALKDWATIRDDVRAIRNALATGGAVKSAHVGRQSGDSAPMISGTAPRAVTPAARGQRGDRQIPALLRSPVIPQIGGSGGGRDLQAAMAISQAAEAVRASRKETARAVAKPVSRDGRGRFVGQGGGHGTTGSPDDVGDREETGGAWRDITDRIVGAIKESGSGMEEADPAVKAFNEIAQPMARGYELLSGGDRQKKQEGWLRRIYTSLTGFRNEETNFNKAANKSLKAIAEKPTEASSKDGGSLLGGLLSGGIGGLISRIPLMGALLRRIPLIGALLSVGGAAADVFGSETNDTLTRREKDQRGGKAVGGAAGAIGGMLGGAKMGAIAGAFGGPVGIAIGTVVGGAAGVFFGNQAGKIIGEKVGDWVSDLRDADVTGKIEAAWTEVKVAALGTWDWVRSGWDESTRLFSTIFKKMGDAWSGVVDKVSSTFAAFGELISSAYEAMKSLPVIGPAIKAAEAAARKLSDTASAVKDGAVELAGNAADAVKSGAGSVWRGAKDVAANMVPQGLKDSIAVRRAIETGADYKQGNIKGLDDAHTRALVASTAATESAGGELDARNMGGRGMDGKGYVGRYQAGAGWLADAGLINGGGAAVQAAMKADGIDPSKKGAEWQWAQAGGMDKFLRNDSNWNNGLSLQKYMGSADIQDAAFKTNSDKSYARLLASGVIKPGMSQDEIAGILKARHIAGEGGAVQAASGMSGPSDANGTSALKYKNDLAAGNIYAKAFASTNGAPAVPSTPVSSSISPVVAPSVPVVASTSVPSVPRVPSAPPVPEAPPMTVPLAGGHSDRPIQVALPSPEAGQDVSDRRIAHIATGGMA